MFGFGGFLCVVGAALASSCAVIRTAQEERRWGGSPSFVAETQANPDAPSGRLKRDWTGFFAEPSECAQLPRLLKANGGGAVDIYEDDYASFIRPHPRFFELSSKSKVSMDELVAIRAYTHRFWKDINAALRNGREASLSDLERVILHCSVSGLNRMPKVARPVFRETTYSAKILEDHKVDAVVGYAAFTSTTKEEAVLARFPGNTRMMISTFTGRDIAWLSEHEDEEEILLIPGACMRVEKIEPRDCPVQVSPPCQTIVLKEVEPTECGVL